MIAHARAFALMLLLAAAPSFAQRAENVNRLIEHMAKGVSDAQVGDWATYRVYGGAEEHTSYWRVAVVGAEKDRFDRDALWLEIELGTHPAMVAPLFQTRLLVAKTADDGKPAITRMYMAWGVEKVQELSEGALQKILKPIDEPPGEPDAKLAGVDDSKFRVSVGQEKRLMTLAGTVPSVPTEFRYGSTVFKRIWISREVPLLHLAKIEIPAIEYTMELRDYGRDAKSRMILPIDGAPKLSFETGATFRSTLFPDRVNDEIEKQRQSEANAEGAPDAH